jgi:glycosyltransferase involved in cell wall biosynthesis
VVEGSAPRVLAVATVRGLGGAEVVLLRILKRLVERGLAVTIATPGPGPLRDAAHADGIPVARASVPAGRMRRGSLAAVAGCAAVAALARRMRADVVLLNGRIGQRLVPGAALAGLPAVVYLHDLLRPGDGSRLWRRRWFWRTVRSILVPSDAVGRSVAALGADPAIVRTARVAVELDPPAPERIPAWAGDGEVVGYVGRLEPRKGVIDLVRAAPAILSRRPRARVVIVGGDDFGVHPAYARAVREEARAAALDGRLVLAGAAPDAHTLMRYFDVLAFPSREEPGGTAAAEALAAGVPVVAADTGGMGEVVIEGRTGSLVPAGDPAALAEAVVAILERPDRDEMRRRARAHAELFSAERSTDVVEEALRAAAERRGRP